MLMAAPSRTLRGRGPCFHCMPKAYIAGFRGSPFTPFRPPCSQPRESAGMRARLCGARRVGRRGSLAILCDACAGWRDPGDGRPY